MAVLKWRGIRIDHVAPFHINAALALTLRCRRIREHCAIGGGLAAGGDGVGHHSPNRFARNDHGLA